MMSSEDHNNLNQWRWTTYSSFDVVLDARCSSLMLTTEATTVVSHRINTADH